MKLIYLASPYSHKDKLIQDSREKEITYIASELQLLYPEHAFFLPITQSAALVKVNDKLTGSFEQWKKIDLFLIEHKVDEVWVVMMDGWGKSIGVQEEIHIAKQFKKPLFFVTTSIDPNTGDPKLTLLNARFGECNYPQTNLEPEYIKEMQTILKSAKEGNEC